MKAIIPAAGFGSRFFPVSKVVPKEMLPIGDRPAIQLIVEEALEAGADEVIIVVSPKKRIIRDYFASDPEWSEFFKSKPRILEKFNRIEQLARSIRFVDQLEQKGLGHAVFQAFETVKNEHEPVLILLGDALVKSTLNPSEAMVRVSKANGNASVVGLEETAWEKVSRYGIIDGLRTDDPDVYAVRNIVEKPVREEAPSNLAVAGRYLLDKKIFNHLAEQRIGVGGEIQLTDAIQELVRSGNVMGYRYSGKRYDIGNPEGYRLAISAFNDSC